MNIKLALLSSFALLLGACYPASVRVGAGVSTGNVIISGQQTNYISSFTPTGGEGSTFYVGEDVGFRLSTTRPGYVTLVSLDPDGYSNVIERNYPVRAGVTFFPIGKRYTLAPPRGIQRVRAIFTADDQRVSSSINLGGRYDSRTGWDNQITVYVNSYGAPTRDIKETYFFIR